MVVQVDIGEARDAPAWTTEKLLAMNV